MPITLTQVKGLLPLAATWAEQQEKRILEDGVALTPAELSDARRLNVSHPEKVRLLRVKQMPKPENAELLAAAEAINFLSPATTGLSLRYGILIRSDCWRDRRLVAHELVHTGQYEKLGGFFQFLQQYIRECLTIGYPQAPMEQEAINSSNGLFI